MTNIEHTRSQRYGNKQPSDLYRAMCLRGCTLCCQRQHSTDGLCLLRVNRQVSKITLWIPVKESDWYILSIEGRFNFQDPIDYGKAALHLYALTNAYILILRLQTSLSAPWLVLEWECVVSRGEIKWMIVNQNPKHFQTGLSWWLLRVQITLSAAELGCELPAIITTWLVNYLLVSAGNAKNKQKHLNGIHTRYIQIQRIDLDMYSICGHFCCTRCARNVHDSFSRFTHVHYYCKTCWTQGHSTYPGHPLNFAKQNNFSVNMQWLTMALVWTINYISCFKHWSNTST